MKIPESCYITTWDEIFTLTRKVPNGPKNKEQFFQELERIQGSLNRIGIAWIEIRPFGSETSYVVLGSVDEIRHLESQFEL